MLFIKSKPKLTDHQKALEKERKLLKSQDKSFIGDFYHYESGLYQYKTGWRWKKPTKPIRYDEWKRYGKVQSWITDNGWFNGKIDEYVWFKEFLRFYELRRFRVEEAWDNCFSYEEGGMWGLTQHVGFIREDDLLEYRLYLREHGITLRFPFPLPKAE